MSDLRVFIRPEFSGPDRGEGGIRRWVDAQHRYLSDFDIEIMKTEDAADLVVCHAADIVPTVKPLVVHNHGLYATAEQSWSRWAWMMNANVVELLRRADVATVPSRWVAEQLARGMNLDARVLYGGIDPAEWEPGLDGGYVLWNKTRVDPVCDPSPLNQLALRNPGLRFVSTFGRAQPNVQITGKLPFGEAKALIVDAAVYLSTSRETFGIGTVEAMACGVPVLGWAFGGNLDIVRHKETGWLARPGDYEDLQNGLEYCRHHRAELGAAARGDALARFTWQRAMSECASIYREVDHPNGPTPKVSVIITCYDLERYLPDCLRSLRAQSFQDWECTVVDDCSPGDCTAIVADFSSEDPRFRYERTPENRYLAGARNWGMERAKGRYLLPLDADDLLNEKALEILAGHLDKEPGDAIAYGAMEVLEPDGKRWVSTWPPEFNWGLQMSLRPDKQCNQNQLPYASMFRREVWRRTGGYRERCQTSEDNDFWCRATSFGFRPRRATTYPTLLYRNRPESMSHERDWPDCTLWYPWARNRELTPFGSVGQPKEVSWPVKTYADPKVTVVIPVGPGHERVVRDALDSVLAQTVDCWECLVVNDTGKPLDLSGFPWVRELATPAVGSGPAVARNLGIAAARAPLFALLDGDDWLMPDFLERCLALQGKHGGYVYADWFQINQGGDHERKEAGEFSVMALLEKGLPWAITGVYPKAAWEEVGGFDPAAGGWEDWDFVFAMATKEICGTRLPEPLWCYRYWSGQRRERGVAEGKRNAAVLRKKWREWTADGGKKLMPCSGCRKGGGVTAQATPMMQQITNREVSTAEATQSGAVLVEYIGINEGTQTVRGAKSGQLYRFGRDEGHRRRFVYSVDAPGLTSLPFLRIVPEEASEMAEPTPGNRLSEPLPVRQARERLVGVGT